jgi:hypothetical protein
MANKKVFLADLTHTRNGITAYTFPLGASFVASYAQKVLGDELEFRLYKFPEELASAITEDPPLVLACSNYSWNLELTYKLIEWAKRQFPDLVVVLGGPNFPLLADEKSHFLTQRSAVDFYIENEGEVGFVELLKTLGEYDWNASQLKQDRPRIANCSYLAEGDLVAGGIERIQDVNTIPSPYLTGMLDAFFEQPLVPMIETTRGCPFSCSFCTDGSPIKNKVVRFDHERVRDELYYISQRVPNMNELHITDLNFGMYKADQQTAEVIAEIQHKYQWPVVVRASAGKNRPERIIEAAKILVGSWAIGSAIQSSDEQVLKNINRSNISIKAYHELMEFMNDLDKDAIRYSEIILALPGDTKAKHFKSLRYGIENQANRLIMHQAILLSGTEMVSQETRSKFELLGKFRIMPGGVAAYQFGKEKVSVAEIEEIIVASKDMPFEDYLSCRIMDLFIEAYVNTGLWEEFFAALRAMNVLAFDFLVFLHERKDLYTPKLNEILASFAAAVKDNLYDSHAEAENVVLHTGLFESYLSGHLGKNELFEHNAMLYSEFEEISTVLVQALKLYLEENQLLTAAAEEYFDQLREFILCKKMAFYKVEPEITRPFNYDFESIDKLDYEVDPRELRPSIEATTFRFFHSQTQGEQIRNAMHNYDKRNTWVGRMINRVNMRKLYRQFERVQLLTEVGVQQD